VSTLFADLSDVSDRLATFVEPLFIVGGLNVHMEQTDYASVSQLVDLLADYGLAYHVPAQTHDLGGLLDVVASRDDLRPPSVDVIDVGLSYRRLLRWPVSKRRPTPVCTTSSDRGVSLTLRPSARRSVVVVTVPTDGLAHASVRLGRFVSAPMTSNQKVRPRPRDIHRQRHVQEDPRVADRVQLLCIPASQKQHPSLRL